jgi:modulator of FtsH protease HflC
MNRIIAAVLALIVLLLLGSSMLFVVDQREDAIVFAFGEVKHVITEPGLYFKLPPPFQNVVELDNRLQTIDTAEADRYITSEKKNVLVDSFVKWRIADPRRYFISFRGDSTLAQSRLTQIIRAALQEEFAKRTVTEVISDQRDSVMQAVRAKVGPDAAAIGIDIVDVRLKRVDLLPEISDSVYRRMQAERTQVANMQRATGQAEAEQIKADADRQRVVILADAYEQAQKIKGDGDAQASAIYADAFGRDPQFYAFYKSLEAYRSAFNDKHDLIVLDPNSDFFRFMHGPGGADAAPAAAPKSGARKR